MIGHNIKQLRERKNYTQEYMAHQLGISQNAYSKIENNYSSLDVDKLKRIAHILEVPEAELLEPYPKVHNPSVSEDFKELFMHLNTAKQRTIDILHSELIELRKEREKLLSLIEKLSG